MREELQYVCDVYRIVTYIRMSNSSKVSVLDDRALGLKFNSLNYSNECTVQLAFVGYRLLFPYREPMIAWSDETALSGGWRV